MTKRSVAGIAVKDGAFFIARRNQGGDLGEKWEFPGGKVEEGESDEQALVREYREEFGVAIETGPFLGSAAFIHHGQERSLCAYRVSFPEERISLREHSQWRWARREEIAGLDFAPSDRRLLESFPPV
jgi:8-oxo-dGTP diphosphatase